MGGHCVGLGDIAQNITKMRVFLLIFEGEPGTSFTKLG